MRNRLPSFDALGMGRGLLSVLFGLSVLSFLLVPQISLVLFFGAYSVLEGMLIILSSFHLAHWVFRWRLLLLEGSLDLATAVAVFAFPPFWSIALPWLTAVWAALTGIVNLLMSLRMDVRAPATPTATWAGVVRLAYGMLAWFLPWNLVGVGPWSGSFFVWLVLTAVMAFLFGIVNLAWGMFSHKNPRLSSG